MKERREEFAIQRSPGETVTDRLTSAVRNQDIHHIQELLAEGVAVDGKDSEHLTPLHHAVLSGNLAVVHLLLDAGADPDQTLGGDYWRLHPLLWSSENNNYEMAALLLEAGARAEGHPGSVIEVIEPVRMALRKRGIYPHGEEPHLSSHSPFITSISRGYIRITRLLLAQGIDVEESFVNRGAPLRNAALRQYASTVELLLEYGAEVTPAALKTADMSSDKPFPSPSPASPPPEVAWEPERTRALLRQAQR